MNCPACELSCGQEIYEGVTLEVCGKCRGVWLGQEGVQTIHTRRDRFFKKNDVDAINRLCGATGAKKERDSRNLSCPACADAGMKTFEYHYDSGVQVDRCAKGCGVWLDADELEKVRIHAEQWSDRLDAYQERFAGLAAQVERDARNTFDELNNAPDISRFRFVGALLRGLVRLD